MSPISAISPYANQKNVSFGAIRQVKYVMLDGLGARDQVTIQSVTKQLVKQLKKGRPEDRALRQSLYDATGDVVRAPVYQSASAMGDRLITGQDARDLENIWTSNLPLSEKKQKASDLTRNLFAQVPHKQIIIVANTVDRKKDKPIYEIKDVYESVRRW